MKVHVYVPWYNEDHRRILSALAEGIPGSLVRDVRDYVPADASVVFGGAKRSFIKSMTKEVIATRTIADGGRMLYVEEGFVRRGEYYSIGWDSINGRAEFYNERSPPDRWQRLGVKLQKRRRDREAYLVCGQVPWDVNVQDTDHGLWCRTMFAEMQRLGFDTKFRPHPRMINDPKARYGISHEHWDTRPLAECLRDYSHVVTYNSNIGVDAVIAGCETMAADKGSMVWGIDMLGRQQWAANLAWAQWTLDEMRQGLPWAHLCHGAELMSNTLVC